MDADRFSFGQIPVLTTDRLVLRAHTAQDLDASFALWSHPMVAQNITGSPAKRQDAWFRILRYAGLWPLLGFGYWAVEERATGRFAGDVGFADFQREIEPSLAGIPEAGWVLDPAFHGRGYATEAVFAALAWLDRHTPHPSACIITPANTASLRVAEKCGYRETAQTTLNDRPMLMLRREAPSRAASP